MPKIRARGPISLVLRNLPCLPEAMGNLWTGGPAHRFSTTSLESRSAPYHSHLENADVSHSSRRTYDDDLFLSFSLKKTLTRLRGTPVERGLRLEGLGLFWL